MIRLETLNNTGDVIGTGAPFTQDSIVIWDPATGPRYVQDCDLVISSAGANLDHKSSGGTLTIGNTNASTINIGRSGATINIIGSTTYEQVTELQVADKLVTINKGGGASSASGTGLEIEENSLITGYIKTSANRNSFELNAPNTNGTITLTPGASGFTLDDTVVKSSDTTVTDNSVVRYDGTGGVTIQKSTVIIDDSDNVSGIANLNVTGTTTLDTALTGVAKAASGVISAGDVNLASEVTGTLPLANGGTGQTAKTAAFDALSPVTTQGDIIYRDASNNVRLAIGAANTVLKTDGTDPSWALIANANVDAAAAIAYSKLNLTGEILDADINASAAVARSKLAAGTNDYVVINSGAGALSEEQYLDKTRGGTGITSTATFPSSGTVNTGTGTQNKVVKFSDASGTVADSSLSDDGTTLTSSVDVMLNAQQEMRFGDSDSSNYVGFKAPATVGTNKVWTLPDADGSSGNVLSTNGSAVLSWVSNVAAASTTEKSANYTLTSNDDIVAADASGGDFTLTLPAVADNTGKTFHIVKIDSSENIVTIDANGAEVIDDVTTYELGGQYSAISLYSDGDEWYTLNRSDFVSAKYDTDAGQSIAHNTETIVDFDSKTHGWDTHGAVTTGANWKFTAPVGGYYLVTCHIKYAAGAWQSGDYNFMELRKNATTEAYLMNEEELGAATETQRASGSCIVDLADGDYIDVRLYHYVNAGLTLSASEEHCYICIVKVG